MGQIRKTGWLMKIPLSPFCDEINVIQYVAVKHERVRMAFIHTVIAQHKNKERHSS